MVPYQLANNKEDVGSSKSGNKRKGRGATTLPHITKDKKSGDRKILQYNNRGQPIGTIAKEYTSYLGVLARTMVPITYGDWRKVPEELKNKLWSSVEVNYVVDTNTKKNVLSSIGEKWRTFKKNLTTFHILPYKTNPTTLSHPPVQYTGIEQSDWDAFVKERLSEEFQKLSQLQKERRAKSVYNHRLGRKGYAGLEEEYKHDLGMSEDLDRSALWKKARQNENGEYDDVVIQERATKIDELTRQTKDGILSTEGSNDILTMALESPEHAGRVRGVGHFVTPTTYFRTTRRRKNGELEEKYNALDAMVLQLQAQINAMSQQTPHTPGIIQSDTVGSNTISDTPSPHLDSMSKGNMIKSKDGMSPKENVRKSKPCKLAVGSLENIVAHGTMFYRVGPNESIHNIPLEESNLRVTVNYVLTHDALLPIPVHNEMYTVGDAEGSYVAWPKNLILTGDEVALKKKNVISNLECIESFVAFIKPLMDDEDIKIPLEKEIFGQQITLRLKKSDLEHVCKMKELSVSCIMIYMCYLYGVIKSSKLEGMFGFVNPLTINNGKVDIGERLGVLASRLETAKSNKLFFVPFDLGDHWILLVIDPLAMAVYYMDSLYYGEIDTNLQFIIDIGLKIYERTQKPKKRTRRVPSWKVIQCPKQSSTMGCGFHVMRYMKDLIGDKNIFTKGNFNGKDTYLETELDEVRVEWIKFISRYI